MARGIRYPSLLALLILPGTVVNSAAVNTPDFAYGFGWLQRCVRDRTGIQPSDPCKESLATVAGMVHGAATGEPFSKVGAVRTTTAEHRCSPSK